MSPSHACQDCAGHNPVWFAPNTLWNFVMGGPEAKGDPGGIICPVCFIKRAEAAGVRPTGWELREEIIPTTTPTATDDHARLGRALYRLMQRFTSDPEILCLIGSIGDTLSDAELAPLIEEYLEDGVYLHSEQ